MARFDSYQNVFEGDIATDDELGLWDTSATAFKNISFEEARKWFINQSTENIQDVVGNLITAGSHTGVTVFYDDVNGTFSITIALAADYVTYDMIQDTTAGTLFLGRQQATAGTVEEISVADARTMLDVTPSGAGAADNETLRWNNGTSKWVANANFRTDTSGNFYADNHGYIGVSTASGGGRLFLDNDGTTDRVLNSRVGGVSRFAFVSQTTGDYNYLFAWDAAGTNGRNVFSYTYSTDLVAIGTGTSKLLINNAGNIGVGGSSLTGIDAERRGLGAVIGTQFTFFGSYWESGVGQYGEIHYSSAIDGNSAGTLVFRDGTAERMRISNTGTIKIADLAGTGNRPVFVDSTGVLIEGEASGGSTEAQITQSSHGFAVLDSIRWNGSAWVKAKADSVDTPAMGVVVEIVDTNNFIYAISGRYAVGAHGLTVGQWYYLSSATAGALVTTSPVISQPILFVESSTIVTIYPYRPSVNLADYTTQGSALLPSGGNTGQVLTKNSNTSYDATWQSPIAGVTQDGKTYGVKDGAWVQTVQSVGGAKTIEIVSSMPGTPDANTIYFVVP